METIEHIAAQWQRAMAALQAIDVTFIISEVVAQEQLPPIVTQSIGETNHVRPAASHRGMLRVAMDGEKVRLEKNLPIYSIPRGEFIDRKETTVFDGTRTLQLLEYPNNEHHQKQGGVWDGREMCSLGLLQYVPIHWLLGLHGKRDLNPSEHSIQRAPRNSVVIRHNRLNTNMLVDRDRGYLVTRFSGERPGRNASWEIDVSYESLSAMLWSPTRWTLSIDTAGERTKEVRCERADIRFNHNIAPSEFDLEFPSGTHVTVVSGDHHRDYLAA